MRTSASAEAPGAVLLDLDGTYADTLPDLCDAIARAGVDEGVTAFDPAAVRAVVNEGARAMVPAAFGLAPDDPVADRIRRRFLAHYGQGLAVRTRLFPGMARTIAALERAGVPWGIVTNKLARYTRPLVEALAGTSPPACVVCGDTAAAPKPDPAPLLHAASALGVRPASCVYVGDAATDVAAARAAGMVALVAGWGYVPEPAKVRTWGADGVLATVEDLENWLPAGAARP